MANPTPSGKIGYCVPYKCQSDEDCVTIGNECNKGSLSGTCWFAKDRYHMTCKYELALHIGSLGLVCPIIGKKGVLLTLKCSCVTHPAKFLSNGGPGLDNETLQKKYQNKNQL